MYQTAVHVFKKVEFAFQNVIRSIWKLLIGVSVGELILEDICTGVDKPSVRNDAKFLDFASKKNGRGCE